MKTRTLAMVGLILFVLLFLKTCYLRSGPIEADLTVRSTEALQVAGHDWAAVSLDGRDLTLSGEAPSEDARAQALALVEGVRGVRVASDTATIQAAVSPFVWKVAKRPGGTVVSGVVPDKASQAALLAMARSTFGDNVDDQTRIAPGAPSGDWLGVARTAVEQLGTLDEGEAVLTDTNLAVMGKALDESLADKVSIAATQSLPSGFNGTADISSPPSGPFMWNAAKSGDQVVLSGMVPDQAARDNLRALAETTYGSANVTDNMEIVPRAPPSGWLDTARATLEQMVPMSEGEAMLSDTDLTVRGKTENAQAVADISAALQDKLPSNFKSMTDLVSDIEPAADVGSSEPYTWRVTKRDNRVELDGMVPDAAARSNLVGQANDIFGQDNVTDKMVVATGPTGPDWLVVASEGLRQAGAMTEGEAELSGKKLTLRGTAPGPVAISLLTSAVTLNLPEGFEGVAMVTDSTAAAAAAATETVTVGECQKLFNELLSNNMHFDTDSTSISPQSYYLAHGLSVAAKRCSGAKIEISGHTDNVGDAAYNIDLSQRRAKAVTEYLVQSGVAIERLTAVGYGEAQPVDTNETEQGRANNRRIEFNIK